MAVNRGQHGVWRVRFGTGRNAGQASHNDNGNSEGPIKIFVCRDCRVHSHSSDGVVFDNERSTRSRMGFYWMGNQIAGFAGTKLTSFAGLITLHEYNFRHETSCIDTSRFDFS